MKAVMRLFGVGGLAIALTTLMIVAVILVSTQVKIFMRHQDGRAKLAEASQVRMIQVEQARGEVEAAKLRAEAIKTVGLAAQQFPEYRNQEFIGAFGEALREGKISQIIYVPTEANIPILEAGKGR